MKKKCDLYTSEDVSRFIDHELSPEQCRSFEHHLSLCRVCSDTAEHFRSVSIAFSDFTHRNNKGIEPGKFIEMLEKTLSGSPKKTLGNFSGLFGKNMYLKLAGITAVVMIGLFPFNGDVLKEASTGPSAIVNSVDTEYASVMIIETQKEKHTIIWFSEET